MNKSKKLEKLHNDNLNNSIWVYYNRHLQQYEVQSVSNGEILLVGNYERLENEIMQVIEYNSNNALLNAKDCLKYGYGKQHWNTCGISEKLACEIWRQAIKELERF